MPENVVEVEAPKLTSEQVVRSIARICRGPHRLTIEVRNELREAWKAAEASGEVKAAIAAIDAVQEALGTAKHRRAKLPEGASLEAALHLFANMLDTRVGCGYDFNETVVANGFDGQEREYECPKCHLKGIYVAPLFD